MASVMGSLTGNTQRGIEELLDGARKWRVWHLIGSGELRRRYARSRIGQFWLSLSTGLSALILGVVWSVLWKVDPATFLPHLTVSVVIWQLMSSILSDAAALFPSNKHLLLSQRLPCSTLVYSVIYKHLLSFAHNAIVIAIVFAVFRVWPSSNLVLLPVALMMFAIAAVWIAYLTALLCTRYRDVNYAMQTILQLGFYITPVIWKPDFLTEEYRWLLIFNPFASFLTTIRATIIDEPFPAQEWVAVILITVAGLIVSLPIIGRFRRQLLFWV